MINNEILKMIADTKKSGGLYLDLSQKQLSELPIEIWQLTHIQVLELSNNQLTSLPKEIGNLTQLKFLHLNGNNLNELPAELSNLHRLELLDLQGNKLKKLPKEITQLTQLKKLNLRDNQIKTLPNRIDKLTLLRQLDVHKNNLTQLPENITKLKELITINVGFNPLQKPPPTVVKQGTDAIRNYFQSIKKGEDFVYEAKLIIIGQPYVGKTSLAKKLINPHCPLNKDEPLTKGIDIYNWSFPYPYEPNINFRTNIWDFGGQHIIFATHNYFLTKRSLYILMVDDRREDPDFYYWLKMIEYLSWKSPVLIVFNEKNKYRKNISSDLKKVFNSIQGVFSVNLANNSGLQELIIGIKKNIASLDHVGKESVPAQWVKLRKDLGKLNKDHITLNEYLHICLNYGIEESKALIISEFLHDLGVILHFQHDDLLKNRLILNPHWVTDAVFQLLFDLEINNQSGEFSENDLKRVWKQSEYKRNHADLIKLMINFEHCYKISDSEKYIIPVLLKNKPSASKYPQKLQNPHNNEILHYEYSYPSMPVGIISRFIVKMHKFIVDRLEWKNGVILSYFESFAEITEELQNRKIKIRIIGNEKQLLLKRIQSTIKEIHHFYNQIEFDEMVPCICEICRIKEIPFFFRYKYLKRCKDNKIKTVRCEESLKEIVVNKLLNNIGKKEWDVFISYSTLDSDIINTIVEDLNKNNVSYWIDCEQIQGGDSTLQKIEEGLQCSNYFVQCHSKNQRDSEWSQLEYNAAMIKRIRSKGIKNKIIPLIVDDTDPKDLSIIIGDIKAVKMKNKKEYQKFIDTLKE